MHRPLLSFLSFLFFLFACVPIAAYSVPYKTHSGNDGQSSPTHRYHAEPKYNFRSVFPQLTWIRDASALKVAGVFDAFYSLSGRLGLSQKTAKAGPEKQTFTRPATTQLPANLLAKYGGDVVLRFNLSTPLEERALAEAADTLFLDVWGFTSNWADIRLREDDVSSLLGLLPKSLHKAYSHLMPDLAQTIYESYPSINFPYPERTTHHQNGAFTPSLKASDGPDNIFFRDYQPFSVIVPWMRLMESMFKTHVRMISIGTTYEGRDMPALKIGVSPNLPHDPPLKPRKTIIISGGVHAREWISVSTVTYIAWSLITSYGSSSDIDKLLQEFDFIMIPSTNPDGYVYTWETDRLWRKNRQQTSLRFCQGLDLDRTFGYEWDGTTYQSNPCSESYPGDEPFQAVESHRLAEWAKNETENNNVNFVGFLDLHSYSQQVLYPYAYSCKSNPPSLENLTELGIGLARAIRRSSGESYMVNSACEGSVPWNKKDTVHVRMESAGGSAIDWFYHEMGVRYSYQIKLRDTGSYGFLLPSENIVPTGQETFEAVKYFGKYLLGDNGIESVKEVVKESIKKEFEFVQSEVNVMKVEAEEELEEWKWDLRRRRR